MLNGVLDRKLAALLASRIVDVGSGGSQFANRFVGVGVIDRAKMRKVQRRAAVLPMRFVCTRHQLFSHIHTHNISITLFTIRRRRPSYSRPVLAL